MEQEPGEQEEQKAEAQSIEGYGCSCGYKTIIKGDFTKHVFLSAKKDGKGTHKSIGRINMQNGEVILPPYSQRTKDQKARTIYKAGHKGGELNPSRMTESWEQATEIRVVPRVFQTDFTPTMRMAKVASMREWGWGDFGWADFFDTCLYILFKEHGITLAGYIVAEEEQIEEEVTA